MCLANYVGDQTRLIVGCQAKVLSLGPLGGFSLLFQNLFMFCSNCFSRAPPPNKIKRSNHSTYRNRGIPSGCEEIGIKPKACGKSEVISQSSRTCAALPPVVIISSTGSQELTGADIIIFLP